MLSLLDLREEIDKVADKKRAAQSMAYFQTGKGGYGADDVFVGLTVPQSRKIAVQFKDLPLFEVKKLLASKIHEERLIALVLLIEHFKKGDEATKKELYEFYLSQIKYINNWDLVDMSAPNIVGEYLYTRHSGKRSAPRIDSGVVIEIPPQNDVFGVLSKLAHSKNIWERRIAIISTFAFIKYGEYEMTLTIADILLHDAHDLIQKVVGWALREVGKRCSEKIEEEFLSTRYQTMPRTMLRYAIERFPEDKRKQYLLGQL